MLWNIDHKCVYAFILEELWKRFHNKPHFIWRHRKRIIIKKNEPTIAAIFQFYWLLLCYEKTLGFLKVRKVNIFVLFLLSLSMETLPSLRVSASWKDSMKCFKKIFILFYINYEISKATYRAAYFETFRLNFSLDTNPKIGTNVVV